MDRVTKPASRHDAARSSVVRAVNSRMVLAYWLIGREIVQDLQGGDKRAAYGKKVLKMLSLQLSQRYGEGAILFQASRISNCFTRRIQIVLTTKATPRVAFSMLNH